LNTHPTVIRELATSADYQACLELQQHTWGAEFSELVPSAIIKLAQRLGGIAAGAFQQDGSMLGFVFGMTGLLEGAVVHWSDMLAVRPEARNQGIGAALKRYQRDRLLARGIRRMHWSFDPLEARNAHVNFARLGITASEYVRDLYGQSGSPLHAGIGTDRLIATWQLDGERVVARLDRGEKRAQRWSDAEPVLQVRLRAGTPVSESPRLDLAGAALGIAVPADIQTLKRTDPALALRWRRHTRAAFEHYLARDFQVTDFVRGSDVGSYVLERRPLSA
jgi:chorismate synthase